MRSRPFLLFTAIMLALFFLLPFHARRAQLRAGGKPELARLLAVTDLCLSTEARYTRNPALADRHAPFQEHPLALEHFPSGSLISPAVRTGKAP